MKWFLCLLACVSYAGEIAIVDCGSQTTHLIARRFRQMGIEAKIVNPETCLDEIGPGIAGIVLSGGPASVYDEGSPQLDPAIFSLPVPILGICYGWQLMAQVLGGEVGPAQKEYG